LLRASPSKRFSPPSIHPARNTLVPAKRASMIIRARSFSAQREPAWREAAADKFAELDA
jgi:hypothetical protein